MWRVNLPAFALGGTITSRTPAEPPTVPPPYHNFNFVLSRFRDSSSAGAACMTGLVFGNAEALCGRAYGANCLAGAPKIGRGVLRFLVSQNRAVYVVDVAARLELVGTNGTAAYRSRRNSANSR